MTEKIHQPEVEQKPSLETPPELKPVNEWLRGELESRIRELETMVNPPAGILRTVAKLEDESDDMGPVDEDNAHKQAVELVSENVRRKKEIQAVVSAFYGGDYQAALSYIVGELRALDGVARGYAQTRHPDDFLERTRARAKQAHDALKAYMEKRA